MIAHIPSHRHTPIEREPLLEPTPHSSEEKNKKLEEERQRAVERFQGLCFRLAGADREAWQGFVECLKAFHGAANASIRRGPFHYIGAKVDPAYYALCQAFATGQLEILDAILSVVPAQSVDQPKMPRKTFLNYFQKSFDRLKSMCKY